MIKNSNVRPRSLTAKEKADMENEVYDSFANYVSFCPSCRYVDKTNMYLMRAKERLMKLSANGVKCPVCGKCEWELGYPQGSITGFVDADKK